MAKRKLDWTNLDKVIDQIQQKRKREQKRKLDLSKFGEAFEQKKQKREQKRKLELARLTKLLSETKLIPLEDYLAEEMKEEPTLWFWHLFLHGFESEYERYEREVGAE